MMSQKISDRNLVSNRYTHIMFMNILRKRKSKLRWAEEKIKKEKQEETGQILFSSPSQWKLDCENC